MLEIFPQGHDVHESELQWSMNRWRHVCGKSRSRTAAYAGFKALFSAQVPYRYVEDNLRLPEAPLPGRLKIINVPVGQLRPVPGELTAGFIIPPNSRVYHLKNNSGASRQFAQVVLGQD